MTEEKKAGRDVNKEVRLISLLVDTINKCQMEETDKMTVGQIVDALHVFSIDIVKQSTNTLREQIIEEIAKEGKRLQEEKKMILGGGVKCG